MKYFILLKKDHFRHTLMPSLRPLSWAKICGVQSKINLGVGPGQLFHILLLGRMHQLNWSNFRMSLFLVPGTSIKSILRSFLSNLSFLSIVFYRLRESLATGYFILEVSSQYLAVRETKRLEYITLLINPNERTHILE